MEKELKTYDLENVPFLSVGKWEGKGTPAGGEQIDENYLDKIIDSFQKIGGKVKPRLILSHDKNVNTKMTGMPSIGYITEIKKENGTLFGNIKAIPEKIFNLIKNKNYGRLSAGIFPKLQIDGEYFEKVLDHVALLGAELPADLNLDYLINNLYENENNFISFENLINEIDNKKIEDFKMDEKEIQELKKQLDNAKCELEKITKENDEIKEFVRKRDLEVKNENINKLLDQAILNKKITPAQKEILFSLYQGSIVEFSKDNKEVDLLAKFIESCPEINFEQKTKYEEISKLSEDEKLEKEIREYMNENKCSYSVAFRKVGGKK